MKTQTSAFHLIFLFGLNSFFLNKITNDTNSSELEIAAHKIWHAKAEIGRSPFQPPLTDPATETRVGNANQTVLLEERPAGAERPRGKLLAMLTISSLEN